MISNSLWAVGETNVGENISLRIETPLASSSYDTKMKSIFHKDFFVSISFET